MPHGAIPERSCRHAGQYLNSAAVQQNPARADHPRDTSILAEVFVRFHVFSRAIAGISVTYSNARSSDDVLG